MILLPNAEDGNQNRGIGWAAAATAAARDSPDRLPPGDTALLDIAPAAAIGTFEAPNGIGAWPRGPETAHRGR